MVGVALSLVVVGLAGAPAWAQNTGQLQLQVDERILAQRRIVFDGNALGGASGRSARHPTSRT